MTEKRISKKLNGCVKEISTEIGKLTSWSWPVLFPNTTLEVLVQTSSCRANEAN